MKGRAVLILTAVWLISGGGALLAQTANAIALSDPSTVQSQLIGLSGGDSKPDDSRKPHAKPDRPKPEPKPSGGIDHRTQREMEAQGRLEYYKRRYLESHPSRESEVTTSSVLVSVAGAVASSASEASLGSAEYPGRSRKASGGNFYAVLCAPNGSSDTRGMGLMFLTSRLKGVSLWFGGHLDREEEVIQGTIPGPYYHTEETRGTYGLQYVQGFGSKPITLVFGVGIAVGQKLLTDVSSVTGWSWDGGEAFTVKPAAQIGMRVGLCDQFGLHFGYDTCQKAYFGIGGTF